MKNAREPVRSNGETGAGSPPTRKRRFWRWLGVFSLGFLVVLVTVRAFLPWAVRDYVNRTLDRNPLYKGNIGDVQIHLWRGAYSIENVRINKTSGAVPVPLFMAARVDFSLEWRALVHRRVVGQVTMDQPQLNFVDAPSEGDSQTGTGGPWLQMIEDLFPFKINSAVINDGSIHFRAFQSIKPVDVYISKLNGTIDNLGNIQDETNPLIASVKASGLVMDQAKFEYMMTLDPSSYRPTFHMAIRLLGLNVTKINDLAVAYGKFDFKRGWFDLVMETDCKEGQITGYAKPLFRELQVFSLKEDLNKGNVLEFFWQAMVGGATRIFKNHTRDQFGTLIPFSGDATGTTTAHIIATIGNILRNAFVRAYLPRLEDGQESVGGLTFQAPEITDAITAGDSP